MNADLAQARQAIQRARESLRGGDRGGARRWAEQAARLAPQLEDPWLILAAVASPRASMKYIEQALQINPESQRARRAMTWALQRLQGTAPKMEAPARDQARESAGSAKPKRTRRPAVFPVLLLTLGCLVVIFAAWTASSTPALASLLSGVSPPTEPAHPPVWARVSIAKPTYTPVPELALAQASPASPSPFPTQIPPTPLPTSTPEFEALPADEPVPTPAPESVDTPGVLSMEVLVDTPTPEVPPTSAYAQASPKPQQAPVGDGVRWIDINLSEQRLYAYEGNIMINSFLVSTGTWATPTVTGTFQIWNKTRIQDMSGPGYYLPDVPYVMYFYRDYGIHGTYWHNNFGTPMSHGCVNLTIPDSEWLYNWAYVGLTVRVHY
jgi:lipoprotein-anchoring transpeptidase ErfK/SrfK